MKEETEKDVEEELEETREEVKSLIEKIQASKTNTTSKEEESNDKLIDEDTGLEFDTEAGLKLFQRVKKNRRK